MQMPCRLFHSAWRHFRRATYALTYWTFGAPEEIRTTYPQIRSIEVWPISRLGLWPLIFSETDHILGLLLLESKIDRGDGGRQWKGDCRGGIHYKLRDLGSNQLGRFDRVAPSEVWRAVLNGGVWFDTLDGFTAAQLGSRVRALSLALQNTLQNAICPSKNTK
jgi:hypothetical protein